MEPENKAEAEYFIRESFKAYTQAFSKIIKEQVVAWLKKYLDEHPDCIPQNPEDNHD